jgi:hypothetical protein
MLKATCEYLKIYYVQASPPGMASMVADPRTARCGCKKDARTTSLWCGRLGTPGLRGAGVKRLPHCIYDKREKLYPVEMDIFNLV